MWGQLSTTLIRHVELISLLNDISHRLPNSLKLNEFERQNILWYYKMLPVTVIPDNNKIHIKRKTERDYFSNQLDINKSDMKKSWKIMKSVIGNKRKTNQNIKYFKLNNNIIDNDLRIANEFNSYFVSIGPTLATYQIKTDLNPLHYVQSNPNSMVMQQIEDFEVVNVINNNSSPGWDGIHGKKSP